MIKWIRKRWRAVESSYWFLPTMLAISAAVLAVLTVWLDETDRTGWISHLGWLYTRGPEGARLILSTVAGSMITVAGVVFSITIVALSLASNQFGPRLLRNFVTDRGNQMVMGVFIATFVYCLLVLRTIHGQDESVFVPHISVAVASLLALVSIGVLIYFIHHVASLIQAPNIIAKISDELQESIDRLFPDKLGKDAEEENACLGEDELPADFDLLSRPLKSPCDGYLESIDNDTLMHLATEHNVIIRMNHRPGHFLMKGSPLADVWPGLRLDENLSDALIGPFIFGARPTPIQDVGFIINQIVEMAVRALSPGINDPFTVVGCLDHLGATLCHLSTRRLPSPYRCDDKGDLRVIAYPMTFADMTDMALDPIRTYGRTSPMVLNRMLEVITIVMQKAQREVDVQALLKHAGRVVESAAALPENERSAVDQRYQQFLAALAAKEISTADPEVETVQP